jgi:surface polysaccharide O-acyltransferase-like enzyme
MSFSVFTILRFNGAAFILSKPSWFRKLCSKAAGATLGVYLIHPMIIDVLRWYPGISGYLPVPWIEMPATIILTTILSFLIVMIIQHLPYAHYIVGGAESYWQDKYFKVSGKILIPSKV